MTIVFIDNGHYSENDWKIGKTLSAQSAAFDSPIQRILLLASFLLQRFSHEIVIDFSIDSNYY